jgi:hypothetical protein
VDVDPEELKRNNLHCPTCGFDMSDSAGDKEDVVVDEEEDDEDEEDDEEEEDEEDEDEDEDEDE